MQYILILSLLLLQCSAKKPIPHTPPTPRGHTSIPDIKTDSKSIVVGAARLSYYLPMLAGKKVGLVVNHTSLVGNTSVVDTLLSNRVQVVKIFAPEHGFRGTADAGEHIKNGVDTRTGLKLISLYGKNKKPSAADMKDLEVVIFDIQDVGARFYTYISTLWYVMEACGEYQVPLMVLDRPNPNGHYIDGPVLDTALRSFVGIAPIPVVHGCTVGELAKMYKGEGWVSYAKELSLEVVPCENYHHDLAYTLAVAPSPNLPNMRAIYLYPSLCFFEGTVFSVGRGTATPFQVLGHPKSTIGDFTFTPRPAFGAAEPLLNGQLCQGLDFTSMSPEQIRAEKRLNLTYLLHAYRDFKDKKSFFLTNGFIDKLSGTKRLRQQIEQGLSEAEIRASWQADLENYQHIRNKYLIYGSY